MIVVILKILLISFVENRMHMKLVGDATSKFGAVIEVFDGVSSWGRLCADRWTITEAKLFCEHFEVPSNATSVPKMGYFECRRRSDNVCNHGFISTECACNLQDAGVMCSNGKMDMSTFIILLDHSTYIQKY